MKLRIEKSDLLDGINIASKAVSSSDTMPVLKCILLNALDGGLRLTGNNLELGIQTSIIDADVQQTGNIALDARLFSGMVKKLPDGYIQIAVDDKFVTKIRSGKSEFNIMGINPEQFPVMPDVERLNKFSINEAVLKDTLRQTIFSISPAEDKPALSGELIDIEDGKIKFLSSDGFRVSYRYIESDTTGQQYKTVVPGKSLNEITKLLSGSKDNEINMYFTEKHALFDLKICTVVTRVISAEFPEFYKHFNGEYSTVVRLDRSRLIASLERACVIAFENNKKVPVKMDIQNSVVTISSNAEVGAVHEELSAEIEGKDLVIGFNPRFLIDALKAIEDSEVTIQFNGGLSPCIIRPVEEGNYRYLVLPLRMNN